MERLLFECAVRAIFIATGTAVALSVMRIKNVVARHQAWTGVVLSMLMLPLWTAFGYQVPLRVLSPRAQQAELTGTVSAETVPVVITQTNDRPLAISKGDAKTSSMNWRQFMPGIYLLGVCVLLLRLAMGTVGAYLLMHQARREEGRLTSSSCLSPITVGWLHAVTILPDGWGEWFKRSYFLHGCRDLLGFSSLVYCARLLQTRRGPISGAAGASRRPARLVIASMSPRRDIMRGNVPPTCRHSVARLDVCCKLFAAIAGRYHGATRS